MKTFSTCREFLFHQVWLIPMVWRCVLGTAGVSQLSDVSENMPVYTGVTSIGSSIRVRWNMDDILPLNQKGAYNRATL